MSGSSVERLLAQRVPLLWLNGSRLRLEDARSELELGLADIREADGRLRRFAPLLAKLFPELRAADGVIESPLLPANRLREAMIGRDNSCGRWLIKADHALPIAGSVKARGGIYEVLFHAEALGRRAGLLTPDGDPLALGSPEARAHFARHHILVGSTGNLGLSIGMAATALGFRATVHMSSDAKPWKKALLRARGVEVIEHRGDYGAAVAAGRTEALQDCLAYFVDDENSKQLFLGYSVAAVRLQSQLAELGIVVDQRHPLFVYLPCGVGGAPGGITFGLRQIFGDCVHCFFAEPVASPCMVLRLASARNAPISVGEIGLDNRTEADGLAVGKASEFVAHQMHSLVSGLFTVSDDELFQGLYLLERCEGLRIEPSAAAGFRGPHWLLDTIEGREYLVERSLLNHVPQSTHILWTTGGALVPEDDYRRFHERGRRASNNAVANGK